MPQQRVLSRLNYCLELVDFTDQADAVSAVDQWILQRCQQAFDLSKCSFDSAILKTGPTHFIWYLNQHHLTTDAWSSSVIYRKLAQLYARLREGGLQGEETMPAYADYLAYALMDTIVDHYFSILEKIGEEIEKLEEPLLSNPSQELLQAVNHLKRDVLFLRKSVWPLREVISGIQRSETMLFQKKTMVFLRDVYDHTIQAADMIETYRDLLSGLTDLYLSSLSHKMNEVMQLLTIVGAIFIPLTFIAGVYGMNFGCSLGTVSVGTESDGF